MKVEPVKVPFTPVQRIPPPQFPRLLVKLQSNKLPLVPDQKTAPPFPFWKLKFIRIPAILCKSSFFC